MSEPAPTSRYGRVAEQLRRAIQRGDYPPGTALPSEAALAAEHDLSRISINKAIRALVAEGLVRIERGRGVYVREQLPIIDMSSSYVTARDREGRALWRTELDRQGMSGSQVIREVVITEPPDHVAGWLELDDDEQVVVRRRLLYAHTEPAQLADSYYPARRASGTELERDDKLAGGTVAALQRLGVTLGRFHEQVAARMPSREQARLLQLGGGIPVLVHTRVTYDDNDTPVEFCEAVMAGDRHVMSYELRAHL
jgi:GntR family transcriptional regulator